MEIRTGNPPEPGRYVVWKQCTARGTQDYCEPAIATWHDGKWAFYDPVICWMGPLEIVHMKTGEILKYPAGVQAGIDIAMGREPQEYDL